MSLIRKHVAVLQAWACLDLVLYAGMLAAVRFTFDSFELKIGKPLLLS